MLDITDLKSIDNKHTFYRAVVEDNNDPIKFGRVRVRIIGIHPDDVDLVPVDTLPWAEVMVSPMFGVSSGIGISSVPLNGSWCWVFLENGDYNKPIVIGMTMGGSVDVAEEKAFKDPTGTYPLQDRLDESDFNRLGRVEFLDKTIDKKIKDARDKEGEFTAADGIEPDTLNSKSLYPDCSVIETKSGHVIEIDDTTGNERIRLYHKSGSYIEIRPDGTMVTKTVKNKHETTTENVYQHIMKQFEFILDESRMTHIKKDDKYTIDGNVTGKVGGNLSESISGSIDSTINGSGTLTVSGGYVIDGGSSIKLKAGSISIG